MSSDTAPRLRKLHRWAAVCAALLLATIALSAFMRLSQAGLGCDDWPACYGAQARLSSAAERQQAAVPPAVTAARVSHRVVATAALVIIVMMVLTAWTAPPPLHRHRPLTTALLVLALALAGLGVITPGSRLPAVAMGNLLGGFVSLALCWRLVAATSTATPAAERGLRPWAALGLAVLSVQLVTGALLSTSYAGLACTDLADCHRAAAAQGWELSALDPFREPRFDLAAGHVNLDGALTQWLHRLGAGVVAAVMMAVAGVALQRGRRGAGLTLLALTALQVAVGWIAVSFGLPLPVALLHNLIAAGLLATLVRLA